MAKQVVYADLGIRILERDPQGYPVEITCDSKQFPRGYLDPDSLPVSGDDSPAQYGVRLFDWFLTDQNLKTTWAKVHGNQCQIRLRIDATAPELHAVPWELLCDTSAENTPPTFLAANAATPFSRYPAGQWPPGAPVADRPVKFLAVIANPVNLSERNLVRINVDSEKDLIRKALSGLDASQVALTFLDQPATLSALEEALRIGCHVLHIVAHGRFDEKKGMGALCLADKDNRMDWVTDDKLGEMLNRQGQKPQLLFLASCQGASRSPADAFRGLAPKIITAGVPTVLAMQDLVSVQTAREFTYTFYQRLFQHGRVDLAGNEARSALLTANLSGSSSPVLFSRLSGNQLFTQIESVSTTELLNSSPTDKESGSVEPEVKRSKSLNVLMKVAVIPLIIAVIGACATIAGALIEGISPGIWDRLFPSPTPIVTFVPAATPDGTGTAIPPILTPLSSPEAALSIRDLRPTDTKCQMGRAWSVDLWVQPEGGDGTYTYYVDGDWKFGPSTEGATIFLRSDSCAPIVVNVMVESGGQFESQDYSINVPSCCGQWSAH